MPVAARRRQRLRGWTRYIAEIVGDAAQLRKCRHCVILVTIFALEFLLAGSTLARSRAIETNRPCASLTKVGCCFEEVLWYCDEGRAHAIDCREALHCGWRRSGKYDCGTGGQVDPSGTFVKYCEFGSSGPPTMWARYDSKLRACGKRERRGCCKGDTLNYCRGGRVYQVDCSHNRHCGWRSSTQVYNCGTAGEADPEGRFPRDCPSGADERPGDGASNARAEDVASKGGARTGSSACRSAGGRGASNGGALLVLVLLGLRRRERFDGPRRER
jgi:hypothetical protein